MQRSTHAVLRVLAIAVSATAGCATTAAPEPPAPVVALAPLDAAGATEQLLRAQVFEDEAGGYDGHETEGVRAFRVIYAQPDAVARFTRIGAEGTVVGKLYAAVGLRRTDPAAYAALKADLLAHPETRVDAQFGCEGLSLTVGEIIESPRENPIKLAPGESVMAWLTVHGAGDLDIDGGGYTAMFAPADEAESSR